MKLQKTNNSWKNKKTIFLSKILNLFSSELENNVVFLRRRRRRRLPIPTNMTNTKTEFKRYEKSKHSTRNEREVKVVLDGMP